MIFLANAEHRVGLAAQFGPPDFQVTRESAGADVAEAVGFGEGFDGDDGWHGKKMNREERIRREKEGEPLRTRRERRFLILGV